MDLVSEAQAGKKYPDVPMLLTLLWLRQAEPLSDWTRAPLIPRKWVLISQEKPWPALSVQPYIRLT